MLKIKKFVFNPFQVNTYIIYNENGESIIVDAACSNSHELKELEDFIRLTKLVPKLLLNTHGHVDHLLGIAELKSNYPVPFAIHRADEFLLRQAVGQGKFFGLEVNPPPSPDINYEEGNEIFLGKDKLECIHVPGHSPGSLLYYSSEGMFIISGDVLFRGSIGRTDLPGGDYDLLIKGIREKVFNLDRDILIFPGHGEHTSIGMETEHNPFFQ